MTIILILVGLILVTVGYVKKKGATARAAAEIAALSAALESYKADNGIYPRDTNTDGLAAMTDSNYASKNPPDPRPSPSPGYDPTTTSYNNASFSLYAQLSGNTSGDRSTFTQRTYFEFKPNMLLPSGGTGTVVAIRDPFGNSYGYSTAQAAYLQDSTKPNYGFNPTFDLWSTGGTSTASDAAYETKWIKNW